VSAPDHSLRVPCCIPSLMVPDSQTLSVGIQKKMERHTVLAVAVVHKIAVMAILTRQEKKAAEASRMLQHRILVSSYRKDKGTLEASGSLGRVSAPVGAPGVHVLL
jgi:hypothetical protein